MIKKALKLIYIESFVKIFVCKFKLFACRYPKQFSFPSVQFNLKLLRKALPLSLVFCGMVVFNNLCLQEVGVAFYTVARSLVTIFSLLFGFFVLGKLL